MAPPGPPRALRAFAAVTIVALLASVVFGEPSPGLEGEGLATTAPGLAVLGAGCVALTGLQPDSGGYAGIYALIAEGLTNAEIAERLVVSAATVKSHVNRIFFKTGARDRAQAVVYAYAHGLATSSPER